MRNQKNLMSRIEREWEDSNDPTEDKDEYIIIQKAISIINKLESIGINIEKLMDPDRKGGIWRY